MEGKYDVENNRKKSLYINYEVLKVFEHIFKNVKI